MLAIYEYLFGAASFVPHGYCLAWRPDLIAIHALSDGVIALSYFSIPIALILLLNKREDLAFKRTFGLFALFIFSCGVTHLTAMIMLWEPYYGAQGMVKAVTAMISVVTAISLWPLLPKVLALPGPGQLRKMNTQLAAEIAEKNAAQVNLHQAYQQVEAQVVERTRELQALNQRLQDDVRRRSLLEEELREKAAQLIATNAELERFAYIASHDLQEPLRKIQAFGDLLKSEYETVLPDEAVEYVRIMQNAAYRMNKQTKDILTLSRLSWDSIQFDSLDLAEVVEEVAFDLKERIEEAGGKLEVGPLPGIPGDRTQIRLLMQNLLVNAFKYREPDSIPEVHVEATLHDTGAPGTGGACVEISVRDNGIGFAQEDAERIFSIFQRLHGRSEFDGTGIGLAICKKIVENHNGAIEAVSSLGKGAVFNIRLPTSQPERREIHAGTDTAV
ncbi:sensor histidine kinase [Denitrobaculum tricleocarpae]|uniref:histidine kinase n=1 Tax=Denitrobaculum tricleocarpae TaxID=2591009 RepID=A0A545TKX6_9PROT|nr:ATP-binding protein [Denitrobaculum tricleocarpae]TQV77857.1 histidine kinase [Denitrobaculum tricleocarpae]